MKHAAIIKQLATAKQWEISATRNGSRALWLIVACLFLYVLLFAAPNTWLALAYGDWTFYAMIGAILLFLLGVIVLVLVVVWLVYRQRNGSPAANAHAARALLAALAAPDDATLPPLPTQPQPLTDDPALQRRTRIGGAQKLTTAPLTFNRWLMAQQIGNFVLIIGMVGIQIGLRDILNALAVTPEQQLANSDLLLQILGIWMVALLGNIALNLAGVFSLLRRAIWVDRDGLSWPRFFRRVTLPWSSVTVIGAYLHPLNHSGFGAVTYVIAANDRIVTWQADPAWVNQPNNSALGLLRLATTQTGLPVRDLTPLVTELGAQVAARHSAAGQTVAAGMAGSAAQFLADRSVTAQTARQRRRGFAFAALAVVVIITPILATRYIHDIAQPAYLATLPAKIHAETPLFSDGLRAQDDLWPVKQPSADDYQGYAYTPQGYTLTASAATHEVLALMPETFTSVAIQVTATENGAIPPGTYDGVGIILRAKPDPYDPHDDYNYCTFFVNYAGDWRFHCFGADYSYSGHSAAIHTGPGATNTLLAIARGNQYIGYVNGQYVGQTFDSFGDLGAQGQIGVVNFESGMQATFTDFTVWPVNPPPALNYV